MQRYTGVESFAVRGASQLSGDGEQPIDVSTLTAGGEGLVLTLRDEALSDEVEDTHERWLECRYWPATIPGSAIAEIEFS